MQAKRGFFPFLFVFFFFSLHRVPCIDGSSAKGNCGLSVCACVYACLDACMSFWTPVHLRLSLSTLLRPLFSLNSTGAPVPLPVPVLLPVSVPVFLLKQHASACPPRTLPCIQKSATHTTSVQPSVFRTETALALASFARPARFKFPHPSSGTQDGPKNSRMPCTAAAARPSAPVSPGLNPLSAAHRCSSAYFPPIDGLGLLQSSSPGCACAWTILYLCIAYVSSVIVTAIVAVHAADCKVSAHAITALTCADKAMPAPTKPAAEWASFLYNYNVSPQFLLLRSAEPVALLPEPPI